MTYPLLAYVLVLLTLFWSFWSGLCEHQAHLQYGRDFLLLWDSGVGSASAVFPADILRKGISRENWRWEHKRPDVRKLGRRGGVRQRMGHSRMPLPTIMLDNVQSLHSKIEELQANVKYLAEYKKCLCTDRNMAEGSCPAV